MKTAITGFDATDVMHFLGRKPHHAFAGEVAIDSKQRPQGCRIRFRLKANAIKLYDHANVLRVETTINNPQEFKVLRSAGNGEPQTLRRSPMRKGVANFWRYAEVADAANGRLLNALARAPLTGSATAELDGLCQGRVVNGRRIPALNPVHPDIAILFAAVLAGEFTINGFRNRDLQAELYRYAWPHRRQAPNSSGLTAHR